MRASSPSLPIEVELLGLGEVPEGVMDHESVLFDPLERVRASRGDGELRASAGSGRFAVGLEPDMRADDPAGLPPPEELVLEVRGWRTKRVEAYWNGCVFVV